MPPGVDPAAAAAAAMFSFPSVLQLSTAPPTVYNYRQCMEIDSQYFYSGAPWDNIARMYVADTLNRGQNTTSFKKTDVLAVSAMEAIGVSSERCHLGKHFTKLSSNMLQGVFPDSLMLAVAAVAAAVQLASNAARPGQRADANTAVASS